MDALLAAKLAALPRLDPTRASTTGLQCKICGGRTTLFDVTDFWKGSEFYTFGLSELTVHYYRCELCHFMFTPLCDDWTREDFARYIYNDDYTLADPEYLAIRPRRSADYVGHWLRGFEDARILDYGSGSGAFAQHMRNAGFRNVVSYDPYSAPTRPEGPFDIVMCFEVIEHSPTPIETVADIVSFLSADGCVLLGECLQPPDIASIRCNWWYCMPRNGHISLYTEFALAVTSQRANAVFHKGDGFHAISRPSGTKFSLLGDRISTPLIPIICRAPREQQGQLWHEVEGFSGIQTRWTATSKVSWHVDAPTRGLAQLAIRVPFAAEVRPDFGAVSQIEVNGIEAATRIVNRWIITAESTVNSNSAIEVTLRTPEPVRPSDLRDSADHRSLGLAIHCE
jgi:hypothetical protein